MAEIELYHRTADSITQQELAILGKEEESATSSPEELGLPISSHALYFRDARTGNHRRYHYKTFSNEERQLHVLLHKNKQYQWLLAEAYETFEDFIENSYAFIGSANSTAWPLRDYGNIFFNDLPSKQYDWYLDQAKNKNNTPTSILNIYRKKFPELKTIAASNNLNINLDLAIILIEKLRHIIVHKGGIVENREDFTIKVLEQAGLYNNGNPAQKNTDFIRMFFGGDEYSNLITILEIQVEPLMSIEVHVSRFSKLTNYLMAYALLIYDSIASDNKRG